MCLNYCLTRRDCRYSWQYIRNRRHATACIVATVDVVAAVGVHEIVGVNDTVDLVAAVGFG